MPDGIPLARGQTLAEALVVLGAIAIAAGAAVPTFRELLLDSRRNAAATTALHAVHLARQLAAVRGEPVRLCGTADGQQCSGQTDWSAGLLLTNDGTDLRRLLPLTEGRGDTRLRANRAAISFEGGSGFASPATLTICDRRGESAARAVIISRSGRPRLSRHDASERPLRC